MSIEKYERTDELFSLCGLCGYRLQIRLPKSL